MLTGFGIRYRIGPGSQNGNPGYTALVAKGMNRHTGETLRMRRVRDSGGQTVLAIDGSLPPRASGPPLHVHFHLREEGTVKAGPLGAQIGNEKIVVPAGGTGVFSAGVVHNWWNAGTIY